MRCPASDRWRRGGVRWSLRVILRRAAIRALERSVPARSATRRSLGVSASTPVRVPRPGRAPERRPRVRDRPRRSSQADGRDTAERTRASPSTRAALAKRHNDGGAQADPLSETGAQERAAVLGREKNSSSTAVVERGDLGDHPADPTRPKRTPQQLPPRPGSRRKQQLTRGYPNGAKEQSAQNFGFRAEQGVSRGNGSTSGGTDAARGRRAKRFLGQATRRRQFDARSPDLRPAFPSWETSNIAAMDSRFTPG